MHWIVLLGCLVVCRSGWASEVPAGDASREAVEHFEKHVRPLLIEHCYECHSADAGSRQGGLLLDSRAGWEAGGDSGPSIVPGDADSSLLIQAVRYRESDIQMPPDGELEPHQIAHLEKWVRLGAMDPRDQDGASNSKWNDPADPIAGREHWAFRPLSDASPSEALGRQVDPAWARGKVDSWILATLEASGLEPSPDADRAVLIRRLSFQLLGLPPSPEEVEAFVADEDPGAYQRLVDRLLGAPEFGRRWGRHWLDLARYADSNGLDENFLYREAWRYRNWVIDAFIDDMPLNEFQLQQIAGDLLPYESIEQRDRQRIASGFLVVGPKVLLGNDARERRMDVADEQLDTIGKTFLAMTLGCARCHDHKFDPIPTADYYALAGIFTSTEVLETRYMLGQQRTMEQLVGLGPDGEQLDGAYEEFWRNQKAANEKLKHAKDALEHLKQDERESLDKVASEHADSIAEGVNDQSLAIDERIKRQSLLVDELAAALVPPEIPPRAMIPCDQESPADESIRLSGRYDRLGKLVPRGVLSVISDADFSISDGQSGRLELARWLTDVDHGAGQLVARVFANRVWHHLMGRGLVRTVDNFGRTGEEPSHPELLDHLASELIASDWSIKSLIRTIVLSRVFTMSSEGNQLGIAVDPENRLYWRANRQRLDPESLRDAMLLAGNQLDFAPVDSTVWYLGDQATAVGSNQNRRRTDFPNRSVYLPVIRNDLPELFQSFDFADPHVTTGMRPQTMVATQGFYLMNDESVMSAADAIAGAVLQEHSDRSPDVIADELIRRVLSGYQSPSLRDALVAFVESASVEPSSGTESGACTGSKAEVNTDHRFRAWSTACHALLASTRFQMVE